jgi:hypothetical protein
MQQRERRMKTIYGDNKPHEEEGRNILKDIYGTEE